MHQICLESFLMSSGRWILTGKYHITTDLMKSLRGAGRSDLQNERGPGIKTALDQICNHIQLSLAAMDWLLHRKSVTAPIVSHILGTVESNQHPYNCPGAIKVVQSSRCLKLK
jgi:hypothetical protein